MSEFSNYLEDAILNTTLRGVTLTGVTPYVALFETDPTDAGTGTEAATASFPAYTRQAITFSDPAGANTTSNSASVSFSAFDGASATTYTHVGIYDASTSGNLLYHTPMNYNKTLTNGDVITFTSGSVTVTID
ncbi:MAG: hypothetical protein HOK95_08900 [Candidatus Marinimicrobia bacterium]|jgi:hypothetical protein|nr:hypothetical protein [Candidatus Neomarinimicrobiota bacterium]